MPRQVSGSQGRRILGVEIAICPYEFDQRTWGRMSESLTEPNITPCPLSPTSSLHAMLKHLYPTTLAILHLKLRPARFLSCPNKLAAFHKLKPVYR